MAHTTGSWQATALDIAAYISDEHNKVVGKGQYREIFNVMEGVTQLEHTDVGYSGLPPMSEVSEMGSAVEVENREGYAWTYTLRNFRNKQVFSSTLMNLDQANVVEGLARALPQSVEYSRNLYTLGLLRKGFDTGTTFGDAKPLISLSHPRKDGGTAQANTFADGVQRAITYDNVMRLQDVLINLVSNSGNQIETGRTGRNLVLFGGPLLREKLFQIAGVEGPDLKPGTNENDVNYIRAGEKFDVFIPSMLSYQGAKQAGETTVAQTSASNYWDSMWGIMDREEAKRLAKMRIQSGYAKYAEKYNEENESLIKYAYDSYDFGVSGFHWLAMSKGDGSTYAG